MYKSFEIKEDIWDSTYNIVDANIKLGTQNKISRNTRDPLLFITFEVRQSVQAHLYETNRLQIKRFAMD